MNKIISAWLGIIIIVVAAVLLFGGVFIYNYFWQNSATLIINCKPNWTCAWGPCIIPPCAPGSNSSACTNGSQVMVAVDLNNCGLPSSTAKIACPEIARICAPSAQ